MNLTFPVLIDSWGQTDKPYKLMGVPETYIIDQQGVIRENVIGPRDWTRLDNLQVLTKLLNVTPKTAESGPGRTAGESRMKRAVIHLGNPRSGTPAWRVHHMDRH